MHYYIDGYNWLFRTPKTPESLEIRRRAFIHAIHELVLDRNCLVTLVFDSSDPSRDISSKGNYRSLEIVFTPGHSPGSITFYNNEQKFMIAGDVLFLGSVGRTDLPGGNHQILIDSIKNKLFPLGDDYVVHSGHGPSTNIGYERTNNPFLN